MKLKIVLLLICLTLLCSCNATYNLEIKKNNSAMETLVINNYDNYYSTSEINDVVSSQLSSLEGIEYHIKGNNVIINRDNSKYYNLNNDYIIENKIGIIKADSKKISFKPNYDKCIFLFSDGGEYVSDDKIDVIVKLPFKISKNNADKVDNEIYTWTYTINDCEKEAYIEFSESNVSTYIIIFIGLIVIFACILLIRKRKYQN